MRNITKLLDFVELTNVFRQIKRDIPSFEGLKLENDAEHSYQLAIISWYIAVNEDCNFKIDKILKYALVHDLVEVYAGDTPLFTSNDDFLSSKKKREHAAVERLKKEFPSFVELHSWVQKYNIKSDEESKFVFAVDKLLPIMSIYLDKGHAWNTHKISLDLIIAKNKKKIATSPVAKKYFDLMLKKIQSKPEFFNEQIKVFKNVVSHDGERCDIHHVEINDFSDIPDELKLKAHAVCIYNGKMLLVNHPEWDIWSIPGGTRENGESIEDTLGREILEEANCKMIDCIPIAYQKVVNYMGDVCHYRLQYLCNVAPIGDFKGDLAGNIDKIEWIKPTDFERYIEDKEFKRLVIRRAIELLNKNESR